MCTHICRFLEDFGRAVEESLFLIINHLYVHNLYEFQEMIEGSCSKINLFSFTSFTSQREGEKTLCNALNYTSTLQERDMARTRNWLIP